MNILMLNWPGAQRSKRRLNCTGNSGFVDEAGFTSGAKVKPEGSSGQAQTVEKSGKKLLQPKLTRVWLQRRVRRIVSAENGSIMDGPRADG